MYPLNSEEDEALKKVLFGEEQKKNKEIPTKVIIISLIAFIVICAIITILLIHFKLKKFEIKPEVTNAEASKSIEADGFGIKSYKDRYDMNNLQFTKKDYEVDNIKYSYVKIDGLKSKTIQDKINKEIKETAFSLVTEQEKLDGNIKNIEVEIDVCANFSNVISLSVRKNISNGKKYFDGLNYDLTTGNKLKFEDLFTNTAGIKIILTQAIYNDYILDRYKIKDLSNEDYSQVYEETYKLISQYNSGGITKFYFTPSIIKLYLSGEELEIKMPEFYKDIAIYNRFTEKGKIYNDNFILPKDNYVFTEVSVKDGFEYRTEEIDDNLFIYTSVYSDELSREVKNIYQNEMEMNISELQNYLIENPSKAAIFYSYVEAIEQEGQYVLKFTQTIYTTEKSYYKNVFLQNFMEYLYYKYLEYNKDIVLTEISSETRYYNLENNTYERLELSLDANNNEINIRKVYDISTGEVIAEILDEGKVTE